MLAFAPPMDDYAPTIELNCGREVRIDAIRQWIAYSGHLEGAPNPMLNEWMLKRIIKDAREQLDHDPFLIPPKATPVPTRRTHPDPDPNTARLPSIACVAHLFSYEPASDPKMDCSDLIVIWFQEHYAFPIAEEAERALKAIDWARLARDGLY